MRASDETMRVLVCGSRTYTDDVVIMSVLEGMRGIQINFEPLDMTIIHGAAKGADSIAAQWAEFAKGVRVEAFSADWVKHGNKAGPIRNQKMLDEGRPTMVLAFVDKPLAESRGTADMVARARRVGLPTWVIERSLG